MKLHSTRLAARLSPTLHVVSPLARRWEQCLACRQSLAGSVGTTLGLCHSASKLRLGPLMQRNDNLRADA